MVRSARRGDRHIEMIRFSQLPRGLFLASASLAFSIFALSFALGGLRGIGYLLYAVAATVPGWPIGHALFGRRHAAGWIGGALIGYALSAFSIWAVIAIGWPSLWTFALAWATVTLAVWISLWRYGLSPLIPVPTWTQRDTVALLFTLLLVPLIFFRPYSRIGFEDEQGNRYYRAYFTADFVWHMALTAEVSKFAMPPRNPFLADQPIHYYWTYFLVPAAAIGAVPGFREQVETCLKVNAVFCGVLSIGMLFAVAWCAIPKGRAVAAAVIVALIASSIEGLYVLYDLYSRGRPLSGVTDLNIRAIGNWYFGGLRVDGLTRLLWYNPQHSTAGALALVVLPATGAGAITPLAALLVGIALGCAVTFNPFVGGIFAIVFAVIETAGLLRRTSVMRWILVSTVAAIPVCAALLWCTQNAMLEGAGGAIEFGLRGDARRAPIPTLLLSTGPLLVAALAGLWRPRSLSRALAPALVGAVVSLALMYLVRLNVDAAWVGFRASQVLHLTLVVLAARFFSMLNRGWMVTSAALALIAIGLPTTIIDSYNAQDITNRGVSPGRFHWTVELTRGEREALQWIRDFTPKTAVVQMDPVPRARETWSLVPSFAERRMAGGNAIPLLAVPEYAINSRRVHSIYAATDSAAAWGMARELKIDYIYVGPAERAAIPDRALAKFTQQPRLFEPVYTNGEAAVFEVRAAALP